ncbi:hypothetical protein, variant 1 [Aphanomyces astaci]|uniref:Delta(24)-sterol reductase n=1 Tax=Aphanomyces astaci TaxID=112090 RepID=W4FBL9_APHAT|nr:hypothetical protein, variant 1 [Aphanomyces astaci]ETV64314.1 hypothetical protein, variant 1 [Aphanomyces astaci]|eukprot:XP_009846199.1 hypothetical protein, variant 1 [Aphanomyces astaci]
MSIEKRQTPAVQDHKARAVPEAADAAGKVLPPQPTSLIAHVLINYRWVFVCFFLLPLSFVYDILYYLRNRVIFYANSAPNKHAERVRAVQEQVLKWNKDGRKTPMCTARPGWQNISYRRGLYKKTLSNIKINMMDVLKVDTTGKSVWVEPLVTMGQLSATLSPLGWCLAIVPELDDLTVGGLVMGTGIETSSHRYGLFQHICTSYELVLADGSTVICSKDVHADLFYSIPWSYGTLGFLTAVEIQIVPTKPFVKLNYHPVSSVKEACDVLETAAKDTEANHFVEALMFNLDKGVVMTGTMVAHAESTKLNEIGRWYKPWFFKHVEAKFDTPETEFMPLRDYFHRHSRSIFWEIQDIIPFGNSTWFRYLLGWLVPPKVSLLKLTQSDAIKELYDNHHFIQDMLVPMSCLHDALHLFHQEVHVYPLWLCPFVLPSRRGMLNTDNKGQGRTSLFVDIGAYGVPSVANFHPVHTTRRIEAFVRNHHGYVVPASSI